VLPIRIGSYSRNAEGKACTSAMPLFTLGT